MKDTLSRLDEMGREMDRLFGELRRDWEPSGWFGTAAGSAFGALEDTGDSYVVHADVPGLCEKDLEISATANSVTIRGSRGADVPEGYTVHRQERGAFELSQSFTLPVRIDPEKAAASVKNGVLELRLPKSPEAQPRRIAVTG